VTSLLERTGKIGDVKVEFIPTAQNVSDIGTKNLAKKEKTFLF
jgi:hypothetical protein